MLNDAPISTIPRDKVPAQIWEWLTSAVGVPLKTPEIRILHGSGTFIELRNKLRDLTKYSDPRPPRHGWAPGKYFNVCSMCHCPFVGDKRASQCADCAYGETVKEQKP